MVPIFRMFVDESGDGNLKPYKDESSKILCLTGVIIKLSDYEQILYELSALKFVHFDIDVFTSNYPLHRKELISATPPFNNLEDKNNRTIFNNAILYFLKEWNYTIISVVVNKFALESRYSNPFHPYRYALGLLMEKFSIFLRRRSSTGDIMCESIGRKEDKKIKETYEYLYHNDYQNWNSAELRARLSSKELKLEKKKQCIAGLEIADLIACSMKKYIMVQYNRMEPGLFTFDDEILGSIESKIFQNGYGRTKGYGIKYCP